jgi:Bacteriocin-protection, YdeI or OmpD-Associated/Domain of unknown function (DUF1905)
MTKPAPLRSFAARIYKVGINRCVDVPAEAAGPGGGRYLPVRGVAGGLPFRGTLLPGVNQMCRLYLHSRIWKKLGIDSGDFVEVALELDDEPREVAMPAELAVALAEHRGAFAAFHAVTPTLQREFILWIGAAKSAATRERRLRIGIPRLMERARRSKARRGREQQQDKRERQQGKRGTTQKKRRSQ